MDQTLFSTSRTAQILEVSDNTLKRWYKWYENEDYEKPEGLKLPEYTTDSRGTKFFTMEAIQSLKDFKDKLQTEYRGCMAEFNSYWQWGQRGTQILENKKRKEEQKNEQKKS